jgi:hypothetical protein
MWNVDRRLRWATLAGVVALVGVVVLYLCWDASSDQPTTRPRVDHPAATATGPTTRGRIAPALDGAAAQRPTLAGVRLPPVMQKVLEDNPDLAQYYALEQKVVPSDEERTNLRAILSDPDMIQSAKDYLLAAETSYSKEAEAKRMVAVEFLGDAVNWADNPARATVMDAIEGVMFADNISASAPDDLAQSLAGDKAELYMQMLHRSPDRAAVVAEHAHGKSVESLLAYAKDSYDHEMTARKADEIQ